MRGVEHLCRAAPRRRCGRRPQRCFARSAFSLTGTPVFAALRITLAARRASGARGRRSRFPHPGCSTGRCRTGSLVAVMRAPAGAADVTSTVASTASATRMAVVRPAFVGMRAPGSSFEARFGSVRDERGWSEHGRGSGGAGDLADAVEVDRSRGRRRSWRSLASQ